MISTTPKLTTAGTSLLIRALAGEAITFTTFKIGNGNAPANPEALTNLVNPLLSFGVSGIDRSQPGQVILRGTYDNSSVTSDFRVKEFGIFAQGETVTEFTSTGGETFTLSTKPIAINSVTVDGTPATVSSYVQSTGVVTLETAPESGSIIKVRYPDGTDLLYAYTNDGDKAGMIRAYASDVVSEETVIVYLEIASTANVTAYLTPDAAYVLQSDFEAHVNTRNPHRMTKADIGLDKVDNVSLSDYAPAFTQATTLSELSSGDKIPTLFDKIAKAVKDLINHIGNRNNPHRVTYTQAGAAPAEHNHSAADINSGILTVERGGTGVTNINELKRLFNQPVIGWYRGNSISKRHIDLGFEPEAVICMGPSGTSCVNLALRDHAAVESTCHEEDHQTTWCDYHTLVMIDSTGFFVSGCDTSHATNAGGVIYRYIAF
jgi:hypothetical protein